MSRPWTESGQVEHIDILCRVHDAPTYTEMAEAILRFCDTYETDQWFQDVAVKLRQIGVNNE